MKEATPIFLQWLDLGSPILNKVATNTEANLVYAPNRKFALLKIAGFLTETVLMGNLAIRSHDIRVPWDGKPNQYDYPSRDIKLLWDGDNMKVANFDLANQFVKRTLGIKRQKIDAHES